MNKLAISCLLTLGLPAWAHAAEPQQAGPDKASQTAQAELNIQKAAGPTANF